MSKMKIAQNGPETSTPKKGGEKKISTEEILNQKIESANDLQKLVRARAIFKGNQVLVLQALEEIEKEAGEAWDSQKDYRVVLEGGQYNAKPVLSFSQKGLILEFLNFMKVKISDKMAEIDGHILNSKI